MTSSKYLILLTLALMLFGSISAEAGNKKKKRSKKAEATVVDTVDNRTFSYAFGVVQTEGAMDYLTRQLHVDPAYLADFLRGFDDPTETEATKRQRAYLAGIEFRQQLNTRMIPHVNSQIARNDSSATLNEEEFVKGFRYGISEKNPTLTPDSAMVLVNKNMTYYQNQRMEKTYGDYRREGEAFLEANAKKREVKVLDDGVQYKVITEGTGTEHPTATSTVKVHYEGKLIDGTVFDSSYQRKQPASMPLNRVIKGWQSAVQHMTTGAKWEIYIPYTLAYGSAEQGKIKPFSVLIFTIELLEIEK